MLVALEIDVAIEPLVAAAAPPRGDLAVIVPAAGLLQRFAQRLVRLVGGDLIEHRNGLKAPPG